MKTIIFTISVSLTVFFMNAQQTDNLAVDTNNETGISITVTVPVRSDKGTVIVALHDEKTFMKTAPLQDLESKIIDGKATVTFTNITSGTYGITLFHDVNGNKTMDFELNGMPKEMFGVSNNVMNFGPPKWSDAQFEVTDQPVHLDIRM